MQPSKTKIKEFLIDDSETCIIGTGKFGIPIIAVWRIDEYHVAFFCPDCKVIHRHGWANGNPNGHRCSHCNDPESRFYSSGYYLSCQGTIGEGEE